MAPDPGTSPAFQAAMAPGMDPGACNKEEMETRSTGRQSRRGRPRDLTRYVTGKLAAWESAGGVSGNRRASSGRKSPSRAGNYLETSDEVVPIRMRTVNNSCIKPVMNI